MTKKYAEGPHAVAICDRCGDKVKLNTLIREEWTGLLVCSSCLDPKPRWIDPNPITDAQALRDPRPDQDNMGTVETQIETLFRPTFPTPDPNLDPLTADATDVTADETDVTADEV